MPENFIKSTNFKRVGGELVPTTKEEQLRPGRKPGELQDLVRGVFDDVCGHLARGEILRIALAKAKAPDEITPQKFRETINRLPATFAAKYTAALGAKAEALVDEALQVAHEARELGDASGKKLAADVYMKQAARLDPKFREATKVELSGHDGGPIRVETMSDETLLAIAATALATPKEES